MHSIQSTSTALHWSKLRVLSQSVSPLNSSASCPLSALHPFRVASSSSSTHYYSDLCSANAFPHRFLSQSPWCGSALSCWVSIADGMSNYGDSGKVIVGAAAAVIRLETDPVSRSTYLFTYYSSLFSKRWQIVQISIYPWTITNSWSIYSIIGVAPT